MNTRNQDSGDSHGEPQVTAAPLLAWRILIGIFAAGSAFTLLSNAARVIRGEAVGAEQFIVGLLFLAVGGWLFPQTVVLDATGIEIRRYFGLMRTRIPVDRIDFYWPTDRRRLKEYLGSGASSVDPGEAHSESRQAVLLITERQSTSRIVLSGYHEGRDHIAAELKRRGVRHFADAIRQRV